MREIINYRQLHIYANFRTLIKQRNIYVKLCCMILRLSGIFITLDNGDDKVIQLEFEYLIL